MSIAFLMDGRAAMKMISSTRSTSIMGVTLISLERPPVPPVDMAMLLRSSRRGRRGLLLLLLAVARHRGDGARLLVADHADDADAVLHREVHRVDDFAVLEVLVGLEIHDVVVARRVDVDPLERRPDVLGLDRLLVQVVSAILVDAE